MRTFAQRQSQAQKPVSSSRVRPGMATPGLTHRERPIASFGPRFGHDFSRIRVDVAGPQESAFPTRVQRTPAESAASAASTTETGTVPAAQSSTFDPSCNGTQQAIIDLVLKGTKLMVDRAVARMLLLWMDESGGSDKDYLHWFGTFDKSRARHVLRTYQRIAKALDSGIEFACDCVKQQYAHAFPGFKCKIHLCALFWSAPWSGLDSKPGVIVHELSHEVLRGGDFRYSVAKAEKLAVNFPWLAVRNADNYEYFAESL